LIVNAKFNPTYANKVSISKQLNTANIDPSKYAVMASSSYFLKTQSNCSNFIQFIVVVMLHETTRRDALQSGCCSDKKSKKASSYLKNITEN
jgi:hypothetical protein